jgi:hypothetical protein
MKTVIKLIATIMLLGAFYQAQSQDDEPVVRGKSPATPKTTLSVSSKSVSFSNEGGETSLTVTTNAQWKLQDLPEWCSGVQNNGTLTLTCDKNSGADREGSFTIVAGNKTETVKISQQGIVLEVDPASISVHSYQGQEAVNVITNYDGWKVRNYPEWCSTGVPEKTGFILQYRENPDVSPRQGQITVAAGALVKTINITQQGKPATPPLSDDKRLEITEVKFGLKKDEITNFTSEIYSDVTYLYPKITYRNLASEPKRISLGFKLFYPDGEQMTSTNTATTGYTYVREVSLTGSEIRKTDEYTSSSGYGNASGTAYSAPGIYNCEIWCNDELKHKTQFTVLERKEAVVIGDPVDPVDPGVQKPEDKIYISIAEGDKLSNLFLSVGGAKKMNISTNAKSYQIAGSPDWITVEKYPDYIMIRCQANPSTAPRDEFFNIVAGNESERIYVKQAGKPASVDPPPPPKSSYRKFRFGIFGGLNFPSMETNSSYFEGRSMVTSPTFENMHFNGGMSFEFKLGRIVSIQPELTFTQKGFKTKGYVEGIYDVGGTPVSAHEEVTARISYVEVPLYLIINIPTGRNGGFFLGAGPSAAYGLSAKSKARATLGDYDPFEEEEDWFEDETLGRLDYGVNFLAGFGYRWIFIRGGYNMGIADIAKEKGDGRASFKNKGFNVSIGFKF